MGLFLTVTGKTCGRFVAFLGDEPQSSSPTEGPKLVWSRDRGDIAADIGDTPTQGQSDLQEA